MKKIKINEKKIRKLIREAIEAEKTVYHGSGASFDKFNHRKFLSTGAGSQTFGWGTYVTEDPVIAKSYASSAAEEKAKENGTEPSLIYNGKEIWQDEICQIYKCPIEVGQTICYLISCKKYRDLFDCLLELEDKIDEVLDSKRQTNDEAELEKLERIKNKYRYTYNVVLKMINDKNFKYGKFEDAYVYEVEIPDDNGSNYFDWYEHFPSEFMGRVIRTFLRLKPKYFDAICKKNYPFSQNLGYYLKFRDNPNFEKLLDCIVNEDDYHTFFASGMYSSRKEGTGGDVYRQLQSYLGSDKAASLFLMQCGFDGIKYEAGTRWQKPEGAMEDSNNYVIFNASNVKITRKDNIN